MSGRTLIVSVAVVLLASTVSQADFFNGFEDNTDGWLGVTSRVGTGTGGVASSAGSFHGEVVGGSFTRFGGYNFGAGNGVPTAFQEYTTSLDIYLDVDAGYANGTLFDWDSAISNAAGDHRRDFIFNGGFYSDATGPGAGTNRFVFSASNNSQPGSAYPKNPGRDPIAISTTGWYTFEHNFYDNGGVLAVDMIIYDSSDSLVHSWTLSSTDDLIPLIGGSRYGWFSDQDFVPLAIDNASLTIVPVPAALWLGSLGLGVAGLRLRKKRNA